MQDTGIRKEAERGHSYYKKSPDKNRDLKRIKRTEIVYSSVLVSSDAGVSTVASADTFSALAATFFTTG